jgi:hypothetical protein
LGLTLSGTLVDDFGAGVEGIEVVASGPRFSGIDTTDGTGGYTITGLTAGFHRVEVRPPEESPFTQGTLFNGTVSPTEDQIELTGDLSGYDGTLIRGASISGTITGLSLPALIDVNGELAFRELPIEPGGSFVVPGMWPEQRVTLTVSEKQDGSDSQFPVGVYDGSATLTIDQNAQATIDLSAGDVTGLVLAAPTTPKLTGAIVDEMGAAVEGSLSLCTDELGCGGTHLDADGSYALYNLPNATYKLFVSAFGRVRGYATAAGGITQDADQAGQISINGSNKTFDVVVPVGQSISGRITGPVGEPVVGASVSASADTSFGSAITNSNGDYEITGLLAGDYLVYANAPEPPSPYLNGYWSLAGYTPDFGSADTVHLEPSAPEVVGTTPANGATGVARTVAVSVTYSASVDVSGATVLLRQEGQPVLTQGLVSYNDPTHTLTFRPRGRLHGTATYRFEVSGVTGLDGAPVANASVSFTTRR